MLWMTALGVLIYAPALWVVVFGGWRSAWVTVMIYVALMAYSEWLAVRDGLRSAPEAFSIFAIGALFLASIILCGVAVQKGVRQEIARARTSAR